MIIKKRKAETVRVAAVIGSLVLPMAANAYSVRLSLDTFAENDHKNYFSGVLNGVSSVSNALASSSATGFGSAAATSEIGAFHAALEGNGGFGDAWGSGAFTDTVSVSGPATSNLVQVRWTWNVPGTAFATGGAARNFSFFAFTANEEGGSVGSRYDINIVNDNVLANGYQNGIVSVVAFYRVGSGYLTFGEWDAKVGNTQPNFVGAAGLDFGNSAHAYAEVLTPGYTLSSESGHNYAAPVPEPFSLGVMGIGCLAILRK
jgi:hypothetical protein